MHVGSAGADSEARTPQRALGRPPVAVGVDLGNTATGCCFGALGGPRERARACGRSWYERSAVPYEGGQCGRGQRSRTAQRVEGTPGGRGRTGPMGGRSQEHGRGRASSGRRTLFTARCRYLGYISAISAYSGAPVGGGLSLSLSLLLVLLSLVSTSVLPVTPLPLYY